MENIKDQPFKSGGVATYMRVGSPAQIGTAAYVRCAVRDAEELHRRTEKTLELAAAHGLTVEAENVIAEYGSGADVVGRPGMVALLQQIERGKIGALVVTSLNRLWSTSAEANHILETLVKNGVMLVTANRVFRFHLAEEAARWRLCQAATEAMGHRATRGRRKAL